MNNITVAFIDDGINKSLFPELKNLLTYKIENSKVVEYVEKIEDFKLTHSSLCLKVFLKYNNKPLNIISIKVLNKEKLCDVEDLILALNWVKENKIQIVNMSLGTSFFSDKSILKSCINDLANRGIIIIAAHNNSNLETYPASLTNVVGVMASSDENDLYFNINYLVDGIEFCAKAIHSIRYLEQKVETSNSNSFAAPYITALVANKIESIEVNIINVKKELSKLCDMEYVGKREFDWCQNAIVLSSRNNIINPQYTYFNIVKNIFFESTNVEKLEIEICNLKHSIDTIIIIDKKNEFNHYEFIKKMKIPYTLILNNHIIEQKNQNFCMQVPFIYNLSSIKNINYNQINVPVIMVYYQENYLLDVLVELAECQRIFIKDGYGCRCFTDNSIGMLYGFDNIESFKYIVDNIDFYSIDLLIIAVDYATNYKIIKCDISFVFCGEMNNFENIEIEIIFNKGSLYEKILSNFT